MLTATVTRGFLPTPPHDRRKGERSHRGFRGVCICIIIGFMGDHALNV